VIVKLPLAIVNIAKALIFADSFDECYAFLEISKEGDKSYIGMNHKFWWGTQEFVT
jgi:hypothetical protein